MKKNERLLYSRVGLQGGTITQSFRVALGAGDSASGRFQTYRIDTVSNLFEVSADIEITALLRTVVGEDSGDETIVFDNYHKIII